MTCCTAQNQKQESFKWRAVRFKILGFISPRNLQKWNSLTYLYYIQIYVKKNKYSPFFFNSLLFSSIYPKYFNCEIRRKKKVKLRNNKHRETYREKFYFY